MKKLLGILGAVALIVGLYVPAASQSNPPQNVIVKYASLGVSTDSLVVGAIGAQSTCTVSITGTWSATIAFVVQDPQQIASPAPITGESMTGAAKGISTTSNITQWVFPCGGHTWFKIYFSAYSSGTAVVQFTASTAAFALPIPAAT